MQITADSGAKFVLRDANDLATFTALSNRVGPQRAFNEYAEAAKFMTAPSAPARPTAAAPAKLAEPDMTGWSPDLREAWSRSAAASDARIAAAAPVPVVAVPVAPTYSGEEVNRARQNLAHHESFGTGKTSGVSPYNVAAVIEMRKIVAAGAHVPVIDNRAIREAEIKLAADANNRFNGAAGLPACRALATGGHRSLCTESRRTCCGRTEPRSPRG
jgi:hypothetical protein